VMARAHDGTRPTGSEAEPTRRTCVGRVPRAMESLRADLPR
jgi:hypothetical protein